MAQSDDDDAFREAMMTLGVKAGARSARAPVGSGGPRGAQTARPPEVLDELDFDALMRAKGDAPRPKGAAKKGAAPAPDGPAVATPSGAASERPAPRHEVSPEERALFEQAIASLDAGAPRKPDAAATAARAGGSTAIPDYARLLKHGRLVFDATCDLHGATREDARAQLGRFFEDAALDQWKVLRIVVGKGYHSVGEPVLRGAVRSWLGGVFAEDVAQVLEAPEAAGGSGALVVIRKRR